MCFVCPVLINWLWRCKYIWHIHSFVLQHGARTILYVHFNLHPVLGYSVYIYIYIYEPYFDGSVLNLSHWSWAEMCCFDKTVITLLGCNFSSFLAYKQSLIQRHTNTNLTLWCCKCCNVWSQPENIHRSSLYLLLYCLKTERDGSLSRLLMIHTAKLVSHMVRQIFDSLPNFLRMLMVVIILKINPHIHTVYMYICSSLLSCLSQIVSHNIPQAPDS